MPGTEAKAWARPAAGKTPKSRLGKQGFRDEFEQAAQAWCSSDKNLSYQRSEPQTRVQQMSSGRAGWGGRATVWRCIIPTSDSSAAACVLLCFCRHRHVARRNLHRLPVLAHPRALFSVVTDPGPLPASPIVAFCAARPSRSQQQPAPAPAPSDPRPPAGPRPPALACPSVFFPPRLCCAIRRSLRRTFSARAPSPLLLALIHPHPARFRSHSPQAKSLCRARPAR